MTNQAVFIEVTVTSAAHLSFSGALRQVINVQDIASIMHAPDGDGCVLVTRSKFAQLDENDYPIGSENREFYILEDFDDLMEALRDVVKIVAVERKPFLV